MNQSNFDFRPLQNKPLLHWYNDQPSSTAFHIIFGNNFPQSHQIPVAIHLVFLSQFWNAAPGASISFPEIERIHKVLNLKTNLSCSPDLLFCDFFLFPKMKLKLKGWSAVLALWKRYEFNRNRRLTQLGKMISKNHLRHGRDDGDRYINVGEVISRGREPNLNCFNNKTFINKLQFLVNST